LMNKAERPGDKAVYFGGDTVILAGLSGSGGYSGRNALILPGA
jgi:hypothetical protein